MTNIGADRLTLEWEAVTGAREYAVEKRLVSGAKGVDSTSSFEIVAEHVGSDSCRLDVGGLVSGECYEFRVRAGSRGVFESVGGRVRGHGLGRVQSLRVSDVRSDGVDIEWSGVHGASLYRVVVSLSDESAGYCS